MHRSPFHPAGRRPARVHTGAAPAPSARPARPAPATRAVLAALAAAAALVAPAPLAAQDGAVTARIDSVFAEWDEPSSPGCALGVVDAGELVHTRGYGSAHLDYEAPLTSESVFYMASVSKQFAAAAMVLAAEQGHLSLDDDVRDWVPELPDYDRTITIRHMIHHTSGLRDYLTLMRLAGMRYADVHPRDEILGLIARQRELNFAPGDDHLYSNSGYFLLALITERATGQSLREYTTEHIFRPLGMDDTHFHDDAGHVQKNRAFSYVPAGDDHEDERFRIGFLGNWDGVGSGGLYSTVEDMYRWDRAFYGESPVGGPNFIDTLHTRGVLNGGDTLDYAFGLTIGEHEGLRTVGHGGSMMGFKTALLRFPDQRLSVICLCNLGSIDPMDLAHDVADIYLADAFERFAFAGGRDEEEADEGATGDDAEEEEAEPLALTASERHGYEGSYYSPELDATYRITVSDGDSLVVRRPPDSERGLTATPERDVLESGSLELHFMRDRAGTVTGFRLMAGRVRNLRFERR